MKYSVKVMLNQIKQYLPRDAGMGWRLQKFHDLTHLPDDIVRFGSPQNTDAGPGERSLKYFAKEVARTSQKREGKFMGQVAARLHERASILRAKRVTDPLYEWEEDDGSASSTTGSHHIHENETCGTENCGDNSVASVLVGSVPRYQILFSDTGSFKGSKWNASGSARGHMEVHPLVLQWFISDQQQRKYTTPVACWTEYKRNSSLYRAHPNFRSEGPWYDWADVLYDVDLDQASKGRNSPVVRSSYFPSKLLCFFRDPVDEGICALVHSCNEKQEDEYAPICDEWYLEYEEKSVSFLDDSDNKATRTRRKERCYFPIIRSVSVDTLGPLLFVVQEVPGVHESFQCSKVTEYYNRCIVVKHREESWGKEFC